MRTAVLALSLTSAIAAAHAQDADYNGTYHFERGTNQTVFSDTALIRDAPAGAVQDTLYAFAPVHIRRQLPQVLTVGRKTAPWYEVEYQASGAPRVGTVWGGALALAAVWRDGVDFAFSLLSYPQPAEADAEHEPIGTGANTCAIKARRHNDSLVQQCRYNIHPESGFFLDTSRDDQGRILYARFGKPGSVPADARFLVRFYMSGEACGIPSYQISAAWDGARLVRMPLLEDNADAGVWSYHEQYVYPEEKGGKPGFLSIRGVSEEYSNSDQPEPALKKRTVMVRRYRWEGVSHRFIAVK